MRIFDSLLLSESMKISRIFLVASILSVSGNTYAQLLKDGTEFDLQLNTITTAVPFQMIAPDSRGGAMGDAGVGVSPDANSMFWNASKLAFAENEMEVSLGYSPWLKALVPDINMAYLSWYKRIDRMSTLGASLRYFSLGNITFTDINGSVIRDFKPNEFSIDAAYSRKFSDYFSAGLTARYIYSNLTGGTQVGGADTKPGMAFAVDVSAYYYNDEFRVGGKDASIGVGINISNIGNKMSYTNTADRDFLPTNLRLGQAFSINVDEFNKFTIATDFNKLLVPTPPIYRVDSLGVPVSDGQGNYVVEAGRNPNVGVAAGIFGSFTDAPGFPLPDEQGNFQYDTEGNLIIDKGSKFREELREVNVSVGLEYWYAEKLAIRAGFFYEHPTKGNRQFATLGAGVKFNIFGLDLAYLIPTQQRHPLANTLRFTLRLNFEDLNKEEADS